MIMLSANYDYCFKQPVKQIVNTLKEYSGFVNNIVRNSDYCIYKFWLWFRKYDYVLVAAIVNLSTTLRPHVYQTPTKLRHLNVEVWFDQTSTTLRSNSDYSFINSEYFFRNYDYLVEGLFKAVTIISESKHL